MTEFKVEFVVRHSQVISGKSRGDAARIIRTAYGPEARIESIDDEEPIATCVACSLPIFEGQKFLRYAEGEMAHEGEKQCCFQQDGD